MTDSEESGTSDYDYEFYDSEIAEEPSGINHESFMDPEYVLYTSYKPEQVMQLLDREIDKAAKELNVTYDEALHMLMNAKWNINELKMSMQKAKEDSLVKYDLKAPPKSPAKKSSQSDGFCLVCYRTMRASEMKQLQCGHAFCSECWVSYFASVLQDGVASRIECMEPECSVVCLKSFVTDFLQKEPVLLQMYEKRVLSDEIVTHPYFTFCSGTDCHGIVFSETNKAHRVTCKFCNHSFCIKCGDEYHAPSSCDIMSRWRKKCGDDSETANYISAHTKDCPNCHSCIEKNGGCNHMQCAKCKHHFCWMCFKDWKTHGSEYYECSRYKENPAIAQEANYLKARRALEKYLHYYERFDNHNKSLKLEEDLRARIVKRIEEKVANREGTWIDWQYLHDAATLLTKCRYTLQYTYPFAYYLETGHRQELFEYQQAQLEKEIEELSWKVERAETTDRADLEKQMHVAECKRRTLLQDFL